MPPLAFSSAKGGTSAPFESGALAPAPIQYYGVVSHFPYGSVGHDGTNRNDDGAGYTTTGGVTVYGLLGERGL